MRTWGECAQRKAKPYQRQACANDNREWVRHHRDMKKFSAWQVVIALTLGVGIHVSGVGMQSVSGAGLNALAAIENLPVKGRAPKTGYSRAEFGSAWADVDKNGCDTRNDILRRDLTTVIYKVKTHDCVALTGVLIDPYSGTMISFVRGNVTSLEVQIDHVVALSNAWQTGAFVLSADLRKAFANDPLNLLAVKGSLNQQKSDGDAATWLPPLKSFRCTYVARQVAVKLKYKLWVTAPEKVAMVKVLSTCPKLALPS